MSNDFHGMATRTLANEHVRLEYMAEGGPRVVGLYVAGSQDNLFADVYDDPVPTPYGDFRFFGGHRLWHAPEALPRTYIPDSHGQTVVDLPDGSGCPAKPSQGRASKKRSKSTCTLTARW